MEAVTWNWLIAVAAWEFLLGTLLVTASAVPAVVRRWPRIAVVGMLLSASSFVLVLVAWSAPRLLMPG